MIKGLEHKNNCNVFKSFFSWLNGLSTDFISTIFFKSVIVIIESFLSQRFVIVYYVYFLGLLWFIWIVWNYFYSTMEIKAYAKVLDESLNIKSGSHTLKKMCQLQLECFVLCTHRSEHNNYENNIFHNHLHCRVILSFVAISYHSFF